MIILSLIHLLYVNSKLYHDRIFADVDYELVVLIFQVFWSRVVRENTFQATVNWNLKTCKKKPRHQDFLFFIVYTRRHRRGVWHVRLNHDVLGKYMTFDDHSAVFIVVM